MSILTLCNMQCATNAWLRYIHNRIRHIHQNQINRLPQPQPQTNANEGILECRNDICIDAGIRDARCQSAVHPFIHVVNTKIQKNINMRQSKGAPAMREGY